MQVLRGRTQFQEVVMVRNPVVAGQFYPASPSQLTSMIEELVDKEAVKEEVIGLV